MESVFGIIAGSVAIFVGIVLIIKRKAFSKFSADAQRVTFGKAGEKVANKANSGYAGAVGAVFILIGAALVIVMLSGAQI